MMLAHQIVLVYIFLEQNILFPTYIKKYPSAVGYQLFHSKTPFQPEACPMHLSLIRIVDEMDE